MKHIPTLIVAAAILPALSSITSAAVVGVDVSGVAYNGGGVLDTTLRLWQSKTSNNSTFSLDGINDVTLGLSNWSADGGANATIDLFDHYKHNGGTQTSVFSLSGLDNTKTYSIVIYSAQNAFGGRGGSWDLITGSYAGPDPQVSSGDQQTTFAEGVNYVRFNNITATGGVISFTAANSLDGIAVFNGFEIQSVPEPSAALLGGLGMLALLRRRR